MRSKLCGPHLTAVIMPDKGQLALSKRSALQAGAITGFIAAFTESPIDFYKSQIQYQIIRSKSKP